MDIKTLIHALAESELGYDVLARAGLQPRHSWLERALTGIGIFAGGVLVGAGLGLIFAPMRGDEFRQKARESIEEWRTRMAAMGEQVQEQVANVTASARAKVGRPEADNP